MNRLVRRWAGMLVFSLVMATLFLSLGRWQWNKHVARDAANAVIAANTTKPVQRFPAMFSTTHTITDAEQWQRVEITGIYDAAHQFQAMQRSTGSSSSSVFGSLGGDSTAGTEVVTPLRTAYGTVLVDRGLMPRQPGQNDSSVLPAPPSGTVTVVGYVRRDEHGKASATTPVNHQMLLISAPEIGRQLGYPVVDGFVQLISSKPAQASGLVTLAAPEQAGGPYLSYALQWVMFTIVGVLGMVMIVRGDLRERRRDERRARIQALRAAAAAADARDSTADDQQTVTQQADAPRTGATAASLVADPLPEASPETNRDPAPDARD